MKYSPKLYAQAFSELATGPLATTEETRLVKNFLEIVEKNNDVHQLKKIFEETGKLLRMKSGRRKITIESAREINHIGVGLKNFLKPDDIIEEKTNPELIAGMKIVVNDESQFDGSLSRKMKKLFIV